MALNHRLTIFCSDIHDTPAEIKAYLNNYAGAAVEREATGEPFTIEWGADDGKRLPLVYGSAANIHFWAANDYEFMDLFEANSRDVYIEIVIAESLFWAGFIEAEKYSEPLISAPYEVAFTAYDGLGLLKDEDFLNPAKTEIEGEYTPRQLLQMVLAKTGLSLPLNTAVIYRPSTELANANALDQYKINAAIYAGLNCYEVLEQLFLNCRIMQRGGEWYVISNPLLKNEFITFQKYAANGSESGTQVKDMRLSGFEFEDTPTLDMYGALKQVTISQDYGYLENLINNADFNNYDGDSFKNWHPVNVTAEQRQLNSDGDNYIYIHGFESLNPWERSHRTKYIVSDPIKITAATDQFNLKVKFALMGAAGNSAGMFIGIINKGEFVNQILEAYIDTTGGGHEIKYRWMAVNKSVTTPWPIPVKSYIKHRNPFPWFSDDTWEIKAENVEAHPYNEINEHFEEMTITSSNGIAMTGDIYIYLFTPNTNKSGIAGACFDVVDLFLTDENADVFTTSTKLTLINNLDNNFVPEDIKLLNGDSPDIPNRLTIYQGGFTLGNGTPTNFWTVDGTGAAYTYVELMARLLASETQNIKQSIKARLMDVTPGLNMVFEDLANNNPDRLFVEVSQTFDFRYNTIEGRFLELLNLNLSPYTIVTNDEVSKSTGRSSGGSGNTNPTPTTDEKVKLINPLTFTQMGQAGYLSAQYFDQEIDPETGRALIFPITHHPDGFIVKPVVTWLYGYTYSLTYAVYVLGQKEYTSQATIITLDPADPAAARIDSITVNTASQVEVIKGTPATNPVKPNIDPGTNLEVTFILVATGTTEPADVTQEVIYNEGAEWTPSASGVTIDTANATAPFSGAVCGLTTTFLANGNYILFTADTLKDFADYETINLFFKFLGEVTTTDIFYISFLLNGVQVTTEQRITPINAAEWLPFAFKIDLFSPTNVQFNALKIRFATATSPSALKLYFDAIFLQKGVTQNVEEIGVISPILATDMIPVRRGSTAYQASVATIEQYFNEKYEPVITAGTVAQFWRGDKTWQPLNTSAVSEAGNLYHTDLRARAAISVTTNNNSGPATYNQATGLLNIPSYTLAGLGGAPASGSANYVQVSPASAQDGNILMSGNIEAFAGTAFSYIGAKRIFNDKTYRVSLNSSSGLLYLGNYNETDANYEGSLRFDSNNIQFSPTTNLSAWHNLYHSGNANLSTVPWTASSFIFGSTGWSFEVVSDRLVVKKNGVILDALDAVGNRKIAGDGYGGGV